VTGNTSNPYRTNLVPFTTDQRSLVGGEHGLLQAVLQGTDDGCTIRVPITIRKRGGRKLVVAPDGAPWSPPRPRIDSTLIKALARAHRWKRMLDDGRYGSVTELAAGEKLDRGYLGKILMLTLLAPDIVEAIMDGRQPAELGVHVLREGFPVEWGEQRADLVA